MVGDSSEEFSDGASTTLIKTVIGSQLSQTLFKPISNLVTAIWKPMTARSVWTCVPMPDRDSVSYTHLDVYKRQTNHLHHKERAETVKASTHILRIGI